MEAKDLTYMQAKRASQERADKKKSKTRRESASKERFNYIDVEAVNGKQRFVAKAYAKMLRLGQKYNDSKEFAMENLDTRLSSWQ